MQILTAGFMAPLLIFSRDVLANIKCAQKALRALAALSDSKMFPSIFGLQNVEIFREALRCGDHPIVQCIVIIALNLSSEPEFRAAFIEMDMIEYV